ncbi:hypothetical protein I79_011823 [Cricetulus griseus]|uniref:Uncharacterized protein n=1 Tax=Cricetulus griseus TaxID=10029 RepID=G3HM75_CRIGR|nr:hypothetical protein I79_011823 [Cricetulus griseus]
MTSSPTPPPQVSAIYSALGTNRHWLLSTLVRAASFYSEQLSVERCIADQSAKTY